MTPESRLWLPSRTPDIGRERALDQRAPNGSSACVYQCRFRVVGAAWHPLRPVVERLLSGIRRQA